MQTKTSHQNKLQGASKMLFEYNVYSLRMRIVTLLFRSTLGDLGSFYIHFVVFFDLFRSIISDIRSF